MRLKWKVAASVSLFLIVTTAGGIAHSFVISGISEKQEGERIQGLQVENLDEKKERFQPREYIKVVPSKEVNTEE